MILELLKTFGIAFAGSFVVCNLFFAAVEFLLAGFDSKIMPVLKGEMLIIGFSITFAIFSTVITLG